MTARPGTRIGPLELWGFVALLVYPWQGYFYAPVKSATPAYWSLANMALAPLVAFAVIALHQALLAGMARGVGDHLAQIGIGVGPQLWPRRGKGARVVVRLLPVNWSHAQFTARARGQRARTAVVHIVAALVFVGLIALDIALQPASWSASKVELGRRLAPDLVFVLCAVVVTLQSCVVGIATLVGASSGVRDSVLKARRLQGAALFASRAFLRGERVEALALARAGLEEDPQNTLLLTIMAELLVQLRDPTAFDRLVELKERTPPSKLRVAVVNLWAWEAYMRDEVTHRDEACELLEVLVRGEPDNRSQLDTYAHMLLWAGRDAAAEPLFVRAEASAPTASCRASSACGLAILHARRGDFASARRWMMRAREHDATNMMLPRAAALVEVPGTERP